MGHFLAAALTAAWCLTPRAHANTGATPRPPLAIRGAEVRAAPVTETDPTEVQNKLRRELALSGLILQRVTEPGLQAEVAGAFERLASAARRAKDDAARSQALGEIRGLRQHLRERHDVRMPTEQEEDQYLAQFDQHVAALRESRMPNHVRNFGIQAGPSGPPIQGVPVQARTGPGGRTGPGTASGPVAPVARPSGPSGPRVASGPSAPRVASGPTGPSAPRAWPLSHAEAVRRGLITGPSGVRSAPSGVPSASPTGPSGTRSGPSGVRSGPTGPRTGPSGPSAATGRVIPGEAVGDPSGPPAPHALAPMIFRPQELPVMPNEERDFRRTGGWRNVENFFDRLALHVSENIDGIIRNPARDRRGRFRVPMPLDDETGGPGRGAESQLGYRVILARQGEPHAGRWADPDVIQRLMRTARNMRAAGVTDPLLIGDIGPRTGSHLPGHSSHGSGRAADLYFYRLNRPGYEGRFDPQRNLQLVTTLLRDANARVVLVDQNIKEILLRQAAANRASRETIRMLQERLRHWPNHHQHFHVAF